MGVTRYDKGSGAENRQFKGACSLPERLSSLERPAKPAVCLVQGALFFMANKKRRKEKRYLQSGEMRWRVPNEEWGDYIKRGFLERVSACIARLRRGVEIIWEDGRHALRDTVRNIEVSIPSSWRLVERAALFNTNGPRLTPEQVRDEVRAGHVRTFEPWQMAS